MKRIIIFLAMAFCCASVFAQEEYDGQNCTSIIVGRLASTDGSVITSHTCDGHYRSWVTIEPAADHKRGEKHAVYKGTLKTSSKEDTKGVTKVGEIPEAAHTYKFLYSGYPCMNEKQLAMGETTFNGPDTLRNRSAMFTIEELQRIAMQRCDNARDAVLMMGRLAEKYGYGDGGECLTVADKNEVWHFEIIGCGKHEKGAVWAAKRIPDDEVGVSANIPRIGRLERENKQGFMCSDNVEAVALKHGLWDGKGTFSFWRAFRSAYGDGHNYSYREFYILSTLAPSKKLWFGMDELPLSVKPDKKVDVRDVMALFRVTYEGLDWDMCKNVRIDVPAKDGKPAGSKVSPVANPWITTNWKRTLNQIAPGTIDSHRTVAVAWCAYSQITQLRSWLPDEVGGICWYSVDNPAQSPRIPFFCGNTEIPAAFNRCGQDNYWPDCALWIYRKANKLATLLWQDNKTEFMKEVMEQEDKAFSGLKALEANPTAEALNQYTRKVFETSAARWQELEGRYWVKSGAGF